MNTKLDFIGNMCEISINIHDSITAYCYAAMDLVIG